MLQRGGLLVAELAASLTPGSYRLAVETYYGASARSTIEIARASAARDIRVEAFYDR
jgi:hypothetical protein